MKDNRLAVTDGQQAGGDGWTTGWRLRKVMADCRRVLTDGNMGIRLAETGGEGGLQASGEGRLQTSGDGPAVSQDCE